MEHASTPGSEHQLVIHLIQGWGLVEGKEPSVSSLLLPGPPQTGEAIAAGPRGGHGEHHAKEAARGRCRRGGWSPWVPPCAWDTLPGLRPPPCACNTSHACISLADSHALDTPKT